MADLKEDKIDFSKLERELESAIRADEKYWRENDAKLRAVDQRVESYEQFRDMVAAAHLRPLDKKDKISESKMQQPWNPLVHDGSCSRVELTQEETVKPLPARDLPSNSLEFTRDWGRCRDRYALLKSIGGPRLRKVLQSEIGMGTLGEILVALKESFDQKDALFVAEILVNLPQCGRFTLALDFLGEKERQTLHDLFRQLEAAQDRTDVLELRKAYRVT